MSILHQ